MKLHIIFMGTPEYAVSYFQGILDASFHCSAVITQPDQPIGRKKIIEPTPVKKIATQQNIPVYQPHDIRAPEWTETIENLHPDLIVVVAFGQIIPQSILNIPQYGCINVHPSFLPRHRGPSPLQEALLLGDSETGVTIIRMDEKMDHGLILAQERVPITLDETLVSLRKKTTDIGVPLLLRVIQDIQEEKAHALPQDHSLATYTRLLTRNSGKINWEKSSTDIDRHIRALNPWPGTWTEWNNARLKILVAHPSTLSLPHNEKNIFEYHGALIAQCNPGFLQLDSVQLEGKKILSGADFARGYKNKL
jgi:methionyl-tRNA formyltransferase